MYEPTTVIAFNVDISILSSDFYGYLRSRVRFYPNEFRFGSIIPVFWSESENSNNINQFFFQFFPFQSSFVNEKNSFVSGASGTKPVLGRYRH